MSIRMGIMYCREIAGSKLMGGFFLGLIIFHVSFLIPKLFIQTTDSNITSTINNPSHVSRSLSWSFFRWKISANLHHHLHQLCTDTHVLYIYMLMQIHIKRVSMPIFSSFLPGVFSVLYFSQNRTVFFSVVGGRRLKYISINNSDFLLLLLIK